MCLVTVVYVYAPLHSISITIFSKFSNFTELHALTQATCFCVLLVYILYMHAFSITEMAVPISWWPQCSWLSLVLPETYPTQYYMYILGFKKMWFVDCSYSRMYMYVCFLPVRHVLMSSWMCRQPVTWAPAMTLSLPYFWSFCKTTQDGCVFIFAI